jgi:hypothetical protein
MKKVVISKKVIVSVVSSLISIVVTAAIILFSGLKSVTTSDGFYAVKDGKMIELKGNAELKLYGSALEYLNEFPSGKILYIGSGYEQNIKGTSFSDLVYHNGVMDGDFYKVSVALIEEKKGALIFDSLYCSAALTESPAKLSFSKISNLVQKATEGMISKIQ